MSYGRDEYDERDLLKYLMAVGDVDALIEEYLSDYELYFPLLAELVGSDEAHRLYFGEEQS